MNDWRKKLDEWTNQHRPLALLGASALLLIFVAITDFVIGAKLFEQLFYPKRETVADVRFWSALVYSLAFALGLPIAFLLWHWRDRNVRDQIENSRKDINLKEFLEVQKQAAGSFGDDVPPEAREQLQIAALHQLRGFLRGEYGQGFQRPAFELLMAGHASAMKKLGTANVLAWVKGTYQFRAISNEVQTALDKLRQRLDPVMSERISVISVAWPDIRHLGFPLAGRNFDLLRLNGQDLSRLDMRSSSFIGTDASHANLTYAILHQSVFVGANLVGSDCAKAELVFARFDGARMGLAKFKGAQLSRAKLCGSELDGVDLHDANLEQTDFRGAVIDGLQLDPDDPPYVNPKFLANAIGAAAKEYAKNGAIDKDAAIRVMGGIKKGPMPMEFDLDKASQVARKLSERGAVVS